MGALMVVEMLLQLIPPQIMRVIVDKALVSESQAGLMILLIALMGVLMIWRHALGILHAQLGVWVGSHVTTRIQQQAFNHLQALSLSFYNRHQTGALMSRINNDARQMQGFLTDGIQYTIVNVLVVIGVVTTLLWMNPLLGMLVLVPTPFVIVLSRYIWRKVHRRWRLLWSSTSAVSSYLNDALSGVRVIKAFGREDDEIARFDKKTGTMRDHLIDAETTWQTLVPMLNLIMQSSTLLIWYFGAYEVYGGRLTLGGLLAYMSYLGMIYGPLQLISRMNDWLTRSMTAAARVFEILDTEPEIKDESAARAMPEIKGHIELRNVTFGYEKHTQVLKNLSLEIKPGEMVGLVGHSGAGKSTLINLMGRLYEIEDGQILIDGVDVKNVRVSDLREHMGFVLQDTFLFNGPIAANIAYSRPDADRKAIIEAAVAANAHEFIMKLPDGYDTIVGERGQKLSGGERQRISIARAILHDPKILVLDEATSSVDTITESKIQQALANLVKGRTTIAIAHRLSTLRHASRLIVMKGGEIVEQGSHAELMAKEGGEYRKLVEIQTEWSRAIAVGG
ncbi:MAG: ABC transporter ATP-binding protein/permease [Planctomycetota bacterium]|nr:ABC transporter ATP-binding protein/permease [Planctomycetota bacterium]